jgi:hypothetical protein
LHWSPSQIEEWLGCGMEMKALYFGSTAKKIEYDEKRAAIAKRK